MKKVYLSGPIDFVSTAESFDWRKEATRLFETPDCDWKVLDPLRGKNLEGSIYPDVNEVVTRDKQDIRNSDIILVNLSNECCMMGTPMEILYAWEHGKPVVIFSEWASKSYWAVYHSVKILPTLEECVSYIKSFWA